MMKVVFSNLKGGLKIKSIRSLVSQLEQVSSSEHYSTGRYSGYHAMHFTDHPVSGYNHQG